DLRVRRDLARRLRGLGAGAARGVPAVPRGRRGEAPARGGAPARGVEDHRRGARGRARSVTTTAHEPGPGASGPARGGTASQDDGGLERGATPCLETTAPNAVGRRGPPVPAPQSTARRWTPRRAAPTDTGRWTSAPSACRSEEHTSELQSREN